MHTPTSTLDAAAFGKTHCFRSNSAREPPRSAQAELSASLLRGSDIGHRQVPVRQQYLEAPLLLALVGLLVGVELEDQCVFFRIGGSGKGRVLVSDGHAVVPASVLGHEIGRASCRERV